MTSDPIMAFADAIRAAGLTVPEHIEADGELHRFASNGNRADDAGWYVFHGDGIAAGSFGDWRTGLSQTWRANIGRKLSHIEAAALAERAELAQRKREADEAERHAEARERAAQRWSKARPADAPHPYLVRKGIKPHGVRQEGDLLLLPMRDGAELHSLQTINTAGDKLFLSGGRVAGCYFSIGKPDDAVCITEGFATGATVRETTGHAVAVAFNAGNLDAVARTLRAKLPDVRILRRSSCNFSSRSGHWSDAGRITRLRATSTTRTYTHCWSAQLRKAAKEHRGHAFVRCSVISVIGNRT